MPKGIPLKEIGMNDPSVKKHLPKPGPKTARIREMLRVDHAGEYGAVQIYRGQRAVFDKLPHKRETSLMLKEMEEGEQHHLDTFDELLTKRGVRPTMMAPLWNIAGFGLGAATALMGEKAAMACTSAVEDVIEKHYAEQIEELRGVEPDLCETITKFREDELAHKHTAEDAGAKQALFHPLLEGTIKLGCKVAIKVSEKI